MSLISLFFLGNGGGGGVGGGGMATCGEIRIKNGNEDLGGGGGLYLEPKYRGGWRDEYTENIGGHE